MKLQDATDGLLYATAGRTVLVGPSPRTLEPVGRLPDPTRGVERVSYRLRTTRPWKTALGRVLGRFATTNLWAVSETDLLATADRFVFVSHDGGENWSTRYELPASSGPMGVLPSAVARVGSDLYLGEYPLGSDETPRLLRSHDRGDTWSVVTALPSVRHVHAVQRDPYSGDIWVTTGDRDHECQIGRLRDGRFEPVVGGSQRYRAVELGFTPGYVLWGMDCVYADRNEICRLDRDAIGDGDPEPSTVETVPSSVFFAEELDIGTEHWVVFATAIEVGGDSTVSSAETTRRSPAVVVGASSRTEYERWHEITRYRRPTTVADHAGGLLPSPSGYVFTARDDQHGLLLNPYNARPDDGRITAVPFEWFEGVSGTRDRLWTGA